MDKTNKQPKRIKNNSGYNQNPADYSAKSKDSKEKGLSFLKVYEIDGLDKVKAIQKLKVTIQALQKVKDSLEIQLEAEQKSILRIRKNSFFIQNSFQSFNDFTIDQKSDTFSEPKPKRTKKSKTIFQAFEKSKQRCEASFIKKKIKQEKSELQKVWRMLRKVTKYNDPFQTELSPNEIGTFGARKIQPQKHTSNNFSELDKIVGLFDQRIELHNNNSTNIFKLVFAKDPSCFYNIKQVLSKHKFYCDSIVHSEIKQSFIQPFNDFSSYERSKALNCYHGIPENKKILSFQISFELQKLEFAELMLICKGDITSVILREYFESLTEIQEEQKRLLQHQPKAEEYSPEFNQGFIDKRNLQNKQSIIQDPIAYNWKLQEYQLKHQSQIEQILKRQKFAFQYNIQDKSTALKFQKNKQLILQSFIKSNKNHPTEKNYSPLIKKKKDKFQTGRNVALMNVVKRYREFQEIGKKRQGLTQKKLTPDRNKHSYITPERQDKSFIYRTSTGQKSSIRRKNLSNQKIRKSKSKQKEMDNQKQIYD